MNLYFGFNTNIPDTTQNGTAVQVKTIVFKHKSGETIKVGLNGNARGGVRNGEYDGRWRGLTFASDMINSNNITITDNDEDIPVRVYDEIFNLLTESELESIEYLHNVPGDNFTPTCKHLSMALTYNDKHYSWGCNEL